MMAAPVDTAQDAAPRRPPRRSSIEIYREATPTSSRDCFGQPTRDKSGSAVPPQSPYERFGILSGARRVLTPMHNVPDQLFSRDSKDSTPRSAFKGGARRVLSTATPTATLSANPNATVLFSSERSEVGLDVEAEEQTPDSSTPPPATPQAQKQISPSLTPLRASLPARAERPTMGTPIGSGRPMRPATPGSAFQAPPQRIAHADATGQKSAAEGARDAGGAAGSMRVLSACRASSSTRAQLACKREVLTPVRRSVRNANIAANRADTKGAASADTHAASAPANGGSTASLKPDLAGLLERTGYAYTPNKALADPKKKDAEEDKAD